MHCDAEPGEAEPGMAASPGRGIYKPVRTDYHEPLGAGGTGEKSGSSRASGGKSAGVSSEEAAAAAFLQKNAMRKMEKKA